MRSGIIRSLRCLCTESFPRCRQPDVCRDSSASREVSVCMMRNISRGACQACGQSTQYCVSPAPRCSFRRQQARQGSIVKCHVENTGGARTSLQESRTSQTVPNTAYAQGFGGGFGARHGGDGLGEVDAPLRAARSVLVSVRSTP
jgi:hypothetical protein